MPLGTSFDLLSRIVEQYESEGRSVRSVEATTDDDGAVRATITVPAAFPSPGEGDGSPIVVESATVDGEGGVDVTVSASPVADVAERVDAAVSAEIRAASTTDDGELLLTVEALVGPSDPSGVTAASDADANRGSSETAGRTDGSTDGRAAGDDAPAGRDSPTDGVEVAADGDGLAADGVGVGADGSSPGDGGDESPERVERTVEGVGDGSETPPSVVREIAAARDESVPPYDDVDYLERLYDACDTFDEMSRLIEMDVASETVRRYMIEAGVHVPTSYDTAPAREPEPGASETGAPDADPSPAHGADTDPSVTGATERQEPEDTAGSGAASDSAGDAVDAEPLVADGVGLPDGVRIPDVVDAVVESVTLHQLAQRLDLERGEARELLQQLNLLDFVPRRLPAEPEQELSHEDVTGRIRRSTPSARSA